MRVCVVHDVGQLAAGRSHIRNSCVQVAEAKGAQIAALSREYCSSITCWPKIQPPRDSVSHRYLRDVCKLNGRRMLSDQMEAFPVFSELCHVIQRSERSCLSSITNLPQPFLTIQPPLAKSHDSQCCSIAKQTLGECMRLILVRR